MQLLYFPHTYIQKSKIDALSAVFPKITVYQSLARAIPDPMRQWQDAGQLDIRFPVADVESDIETLLRSYQELGNQQFTRTGELQNYRSDDIPFFNDSSPQKIRNDLTQRIQANGTPKDEDATRKTRLIQAAVFLQMAQDFDCHHEDIGRHVAAGAGMEKALFDNLKGHEDPLFREMAVHRLSTENETRHHMLSERLAAWTRLFLHEWAGAAPELPAAPLIFVTPSRQLFDDISEKAAGGINLTFDSGVARQQPLTDILTALAQASDIVSACQPYREPSHKTETPEPIVVHALIVPEESPRFLAKCAGLPGYLIPTAHVPGPQPNTLISYVETK